MATYAWQKEHTKKYTLKISKNTDQDIFQKLENIDNFNGYIKRLIREDLKKEQERE